jgi:hypothetical protein
VNAALIANDQPGLAALRYLARAVRFSDDAGLRRNAVRRALELWAQRGTMGELPVPLADLIRAELAALPDDDDLHHDLLSLALRYERSWLARQRVPAEGPVRPRRIARWFHARAALEESRTADTLAEAAIAVSALWHLRNRPGWVEGERAWLVDRIADALTDEDGDPATAIEELARHRVLPDEFRLVLLAAAGAKLVHRGAPDDDRVRRLLFAPVAEFRGRADRDPTTAEQLAGAVSRAAVAVVNGTREFAKTLDGQLKELNRTAGTTWKENQPNVARRRRLINELESRANRYVRYIDLMAGLPVPAELRSVMVSDAEYWYRIIPELRRRAV